MKRLFAKTVGISALPKDGANTYTITLYDLGACSPGRRWHSALPLAAVGCHFFGIHSTTLLSTLSFSVNMTDRVAPG